MPSGTRRLTHPGDSYSYDMFSQAGQAIRDHADLVLGGLQPDRLIAAGESQSAGRLVTYIDAVHPLVGVYDAFLVHSRGAGGAALSQAPLPVVSTPLPTLIRGDLDVPVLVFNTETDAGSLQARQPDSPNYRLWEVAGTAHFDQYGLMTGATDAGERSSVAEWFDTMLHPTSQPNPSFTCGSPINTGPQTFVLRAAISHLNRWVTRGTPPPEAPRLETITIAPVQYVLDANGNVRGGIRTPAVDAPVAKLSGLGQTGTQFCALFGTTSALHAGAAHRALPQPRRLRPVLDPSDAERHLRRVPPTRGRLQHPGRRRPIRHPADDNGVPRVREHRDGCSRNLPPGRWSGRELHLQRRGGR